MGCFYTGRNHYRRINLRLKLGQSEKDSPAQRLASIRSEEPFECLAYIVMPKATKAECLAVESHARLMMERNTQFQNVQNDHFTYKKKDTDDKDVIAMLFSTLAIKYAVEACQMYNIKYSLGTKTFKRGKPNKD